VSSAPAKSSLDSNPIPGARITSETSEGERLPISRFALFFAILAVGLASDLLTKSIALGNFPPSGMEPEWWIDQVLGVQTSLNGGALFGLGQGGSFWFAILSIIAFGAILFWLFARKLARSLWLTITLAMVSAGILGNFYDRIGLGYDQTWNNTELKGHVRDWIHFRWEGISFMDPWPNFNIADSLLVSGAIMLFVFALFGAEKPSSHTETSEIND